MPIDSIGPRQPGMIPEPEGEQPDVSTGQGVKGTQGPKAAGEAAVEAGPKQASKITEGIDIPKLAEAAGERLGEAKFQGVLVRDQLQLPAERATDAGVRGKLAPAEAEPGAWEAKFRGEGAQALDHDHKVAAGLQTQGKLQFADEKVSMVAQKLHGEIHQKKWDKDLLVQEKLKHAGERVSQQSNKLAGEAEVKLDKDLLVQEKLKHAGEPMSYKTAKRAGEVEEKWDKDLLVRDKVKLANESAITLPRSKSQNVGGDAGVWGAKLQGKGSSAAEKIGDTKGDSLAGVHKDAILIESNAPGPQLDKDHKAFHVAENLGMVQSQNIWGERHVQKGVLEVQEQVDLSEDSRVVETKPPDIKG